MNQKPDDYSNLYGKPQVQDPIPQRIEPVVQSPSNSYENLYEETDEPTVQGIPEQVYFAPPKPKKPFSPIPLLLIAGVGFLFLGGIIFLTSTWKMLSNPVRAIALLSASAIAFGANRLAEKVLKLPKTGLAFYILGCIFLPLALGGIGQFELFGHWFSFHGEGDLLLKSLIYLCISGTAYLGRYNYQSKFLAWLSLAGIAGTWWYFTKFLGVVVFRDILVHQVAMVLFAVGATFWAEWYLKRKPDTPTAKVAVWFLHPLLYVATFALSGAEPLATCLLSLIMAVLFVNERFLKQKVHTGVVGFSFAMTVFGYGVTDFPAMDFLESGQSFLLATSLVAVFLLAFENIPKLQPETVKTFKFGGYLFSIPMILVAGAESIFDDDFMWLFPVMMITAVVFIVKMGKNPLPTSAMPMIFYLMIVFIGAIYPEENVFLVLLTVSALLLLVQAFINQKLWCFGVSIGTCAGIIATQTENALLWVQWICVIGLFAGMVYAHLQLRFILERCFALTGGVFLVTALQMTFSADAVDLQPYENLILILAIIGILYIVESVFLWQHLRTVETKPFLETLSVELSLIAVPAYLIYLEDYSARYLELVLWGLVLSVILIGFSAVLLRKDRNGVAVPQLFLFFLTARELIDDLRYVFPHSQGTSELKFIQVVLLLGVLAGLAILGRMLLPQFRTVDVDKKQTDWALLTGVLIIFSVAFTIDWYPSILIFLFLSIYSLLYIGRVQNRYIPALLASLFGSLTIFFHNVNDPFDIIHDLRINDINTLQILMYLLPIHLFIFSLLFILPEIYRENVHKARFAMYCITMLVLLIASLGYGNVTDAILLVVFSFGILLGSFAVKRLRWFTLGFAMLVVMTIRMTWKFWTSLHWGIYLFLAGIVLIGLASFYEYSARYTAEHPDEPKKKFQLFATWKW